MDMSLSQRKYYILVALIWPCSRMPDGKHLPAEDTHEKLMKSFSVGRPNLIFIDVCLFIWRYILSILVLFFLVPDVSMNNSSHNIDEYIIVENATFSCGKTVRTQPHPNPHKVESQ